MSDFCENKKNGKECRDKAEFECSVCGKKFCSDCSSQAAYECPFCPEPVIVPIEEGEEEN